MPRLDKLQIIIGYQFSDDSVLTQALTHKSYAGQNNERLEFLGDSILNHAIAVDLFRRFPDAKEGQLSRLRASMVKQKTLAELAREFNLGDYLIMGSGELKSGGFRRDSILSDAVEAIIGAIYLDSNHDIVHEKVQAWFALRLEGLSLEHSLIDAKSRLQEFLQAKQIDLPHYEIVRTEGESHAQTFYVDCSCALLDQPVSAEGASRRIAEQNAAQLALLKLGVNHEQGR